MMTKIVTRGVSGLLMIAAVAMFASGATEPGKAEPKPVADQAANTQTEAFPPGAIALF